MNSVSKLVERLCPEGVKWVTLGEVCELQKVRNRNQAVSRAYSITQGGLVPTTEFFKEKTHVTSSNTSGYYVVKKNWFVYSPSRVDVGSIDYLKEDEPVIVSPIDIVFSIISEDTILPEYLFQYLLSPKGKYDMLRYRLGIEGTGRKSLPFSEISKMEIPLPPKEVQEEIVSILDGFTKVIDKIDELIKLRQQQFEYYCDNLYGGNIEGMKKKCANGDAELKTFAELGTITRGKRFVRDDIKESGQPCIHYGDMYTYYGVEAKTAKTYLDRDFPKKMRYAKPGDIVIVGAGENDLDIGVALAWHGDEPAVVHDACYILEHTINDMYIAYFTRSGNYHQQLRKYVSDGKICSVSADGVGRVLIPVPSLTKQKEIVNTLDKFEEVIEKLKKKRDLRQKQYEYYREALLTF